jgi:hypothetical protein
VPVVSYSEGWGRDLWQDSDHVSHFIRVGYGDAWKTPNVQPTSNRHLAIIDPQNSAGIPGSHGHLDIEYEGGKLDEYAGVRATKEFLETIRAELA